MADRVRIIRLVSTGDERGDSFNVPPEIFSFLGGIADIHLTSLVPGAVRGNHYHLRRREVLMVKHETDWSLYWDVGMGTAVKTSQISGTGVALILIEPGCSHALQNCGTGSMTIFSLNSEAYDPAETVARKLI